MKISKEKILVLSSVIASLLLIELLLKILSVNLPANDLKSALYKEYSVEELDLSIPFRHKNHGGECIKPRFSKKMQWHPRFGWNDKKKGLNKVCFIGGITLLVNYFYYMLSPKTDYMILHLNEENQRKEWLKINKTMQFKYHIGLLLGIVASMVLAYAVKC